MQVAEQGKHIARHPGSSIGARVVGLVAPAVAARVEADHLQAVRVQALDPPEHRIVALEAGRAPVDEHDGMALPVHLVVERMALVREVRHRALFRRRRHRGRMVIDDHPVPVALAIDEAEPCRDARRLSILHVREGVVAAVDRGIYVETNFSWSIDDSRNKFQFGCEWGQLIEDGRLTSVVRNPNYRGISSNFWRSLKGVGDRDSYFVGGASQCGKGEPNQAVPVGHATPACLFAAVDVFGGAA